MPLHLERTQTENSFSSLVSYQIPHFKNLPLAMNFLVFSVSRRLLVQFGIEEK